MRAAGRSNNPSSLGDSTMLFPTSNSRRSFLQQAAALSVAGISGRAFCAEPSPPASTPESLVKVLYDSFSEKQKQEVCFAWDYVEKQRGLLRTRLENNWKITKPNI